MSCRACKSQRVLSISAKCSDCFCCNDFDGYVPDDMGIGRGDYVAFSYCLDCGTIQGNFPLPPCRAEGNTERCDECGSYTIIETKHGYYSKVCETCGLAVEGTIE